VGPKIHDNTLCPSGKHVICTVHTSIKNYGHGISDIARHLALAAEAQDISTQSGHQIIFLNVDAQNARFIVPQQKCLKIYFVNQPQIYTKFILTVEVYNSYKKLCVSLTQSRPTWYTLVQLVKTDSVFADHCMC